MASPEILEQDDTGSLTLTVDTIFHVAKGVVELTTDTDAGYIPFYADNPTWNRVIFYAGQTVYWRNVRHSDATLIYFPMGV